MNHYAYVMLALDIARERSLEAERHWLATAVSGGAPRRPSRVRRLAAGLLVAISRSAAGAARRLDTRVADDLPRTLAPAE
jgi:hypothetical protein